MKLLAQEKLEEFKNQIMQAIRIVFGIIVSIVIAEFVGVEFAPSTGVVAMLGIQNTKRASIKTLFRRVISFGYTMGFAMLIHEYIGVSTVEFVFLVFCIVMVTMLLNWENTLSINIVIAVHLFMQQEAFTTALLLNETKRIIIGVAVAMVVNWTHSSKETVFENLIIELEEGLKKILINDCLFLNGQIGYEEIQPLMEEYSRKIKKGIKDAHTYADNNLLPHASYYAEYMKMREKEYVILENIYSLFNQFHRIPDQAQILAKHLGEMAEDVPVRKSMDPWLKNFDEMRFEMERATNPDNMPDFEDSAAVLFIIRDLQQMIHIKQDFIVALTPQQLKRYHHE